MCNTYDKKFIKRFNKVLKKLGNVELDMPLEDLLVKYDKDFSEYEMEWKRYDVSYEDGCILYFLSKCKPYSDLLVQYNVTVNEFIIKENIIFHLKGIFTESNRKKVA